jgi:choline dehydrogenase-like flavoprotein
MPSPRADSFDAIVVGSGPGGATVARELSRRGKRVLILERGHNRPIKGTTAQCVGYLLVPGKGLLFTNQLLALGRGIITGGSSIAAYATALDPPLEKFTSYGIDLAGELAEARKELPIAPLADRLVGPLARRTMESARSLGYDWKKLDKIVYQDKCLPDCDKCTMGCPHGAKWDARVYVGEAVRSGAVLKASAKVNKVLLENRTAVGVEYTQKGKTHRIYAPTIVVSAGGIGSPLILRKSGLTGAGHDFFFDPLIAVMGTVKINDLVDSDLKTEFDNLYVCDCSVIPFSWGMPPILTLVCLGKRLAKHLVKEKTGGQVVKNPFVYDIS